jgi:hypothetical protein
MKTMYIDPGKHRCGVALFVDSALEWADWVPSGDVPGLVVREAPDVVLMENPKDYARFAVAHKDLDSLRAVLASASKAAKKVGARVEKVSPSEWKGNVPKPVHHNRVMQALDARERALMETFGAVGSTKYEAGGHNTWDAVALGMFGTKRLGRGGKKEDS